MKKYIVKISVAFSTSSYKKYSWITQFQQVSIENASIWFLKLETCLLLLNALSPYRYVLLKNCRSNGSVFLLALFLKKLFKQKAIFSNKTSVPAWFRCIWCFRCFMVEPLKPWMGAEAPRILLLSFSALALLTILVPKI